MLTFGKQHLPMRIFTPSSNTLPQSALGLGRNSTFIETLHDAQLIASRTWSLFWGLEGADPSSQMEGSLMFGGYDRAKTTGPNMTRAFSSLEDQASCPSSMIVTVANIILTFANGTSTSLMSPPSTAFSACVKPDIPLLTLPTDVFTTFSTSIGGTYLAPSESYKLWGMDFAASGIFDGTLTYTFSSGLSITIPNSQLVVPDVQVSTTGTTFIPDPSTRELLIYADPVTGSDMPLLGQVFMTAAYLHVNNDKQEFTMWQAQPTTETDIVIVGDNCIAADAAPSSVPRPQTQPSAKPTLTSAQLAGIALSGAACILLTTLAGYFYLIRRHRRRLALESSKEIPWNNNVGINRFSKAELAGSTAKVPAVLKYELDADAIQKGGTRKSLPQPPRWASAREVGGRCELDAQ